MNTHIGVGEARRLVHTVTDTAVNVVDKTEVANLLHSKERHVLGDVRCTDAEKQAPKPV